MPQAEYLLGHSEREIQRLMHQAVILRPITERLFREITETGHARARFGVRRR
jgi:hypothetical protein